MCSSDLDFVDEAQPRRDLLFGGVVNRGAVARAAQEHRLEDHPSLEAFHRLDRGAHAVGGALRVVDEIGRASCRERV